MVRQVVTTLLICILLVGAVCTQANAVTHQVYEEGNINTTYLDYFRDIVSGIGFNDNYVAFRSSQYSYTIVVGDLNFNEGNFTLNSPCKEYVFYIEQSGYNSIYKYYVNDITTFDLQSNSNIIYSDLGYYPQLVERGAKYEILTSVLLCIFGLCIIIYRIFRKR